MIKITEIAILGVISMDEGNYLCCEIYFENTYLNNGLRK